MLLSQCLLVLTSYLSIVLCKELDVLILHNNDMHSQFEETNKRYSKCPKLGADNCYGGFARVAHVLKTARKDAETGKGPPVLFFNAGDTYTGTAWFVIHKSTIVIDFLNALKPDAMALGNHEFDDGIPGVLPLLEKSIFPIVVANIDDNRLKGLKKSTIVTAAGYKIGVIGYLTPQTREISEAEDIQFTNEVIAINKEAEIIKGQGIKTIFAVGHSGFEMDKLIAKKCPLVDLVVGGHTNTFLWNGPKPNIEIPKSVYPTVVTQGSGKKVPVVQAYAYTKYLGKLYIKINKKTGGLTHFEGQPLLLNATVPQDPEVLKLLDKYRREVDTLDHKIMGKTKVYLEGRDYICRIRECNLGNLITDSFIDYRARDYTGFFWTDIAIAIINSGAIRMSIDTSRKQRVISQADLANTLPFNNDIVSVTLTGKDLLQVLEFSIHSNGETSRGEFLQYSGIQVTYDRRNPVGSRLVSAKARCASCFVPIFEPIKENRKYKIMLTTFLARGGDGYGIIKKNCTNKTVLGIHDFDSVVTYVEKNKIVYPGVEGRITILESGASRIISIISIVWVSIFRFVISNILVR